MKFNPSKFEQQLNDKTLYNFKGKDSPEPPNTVLFNWDSFSKDKRPFTIHSNKAQSNFRETYYENFKNINKPNPMLNSLYLPKNKKKTKKYNELDVRPTMNIRANIKLPVELYANVGEDQSTGISPTNYDIIHFRANTIESGRFSKPKAVLPTLSTKPKEDFRPCTGNTELKDLMADKVAKVIPRGRVGTAQIQKLNKGQRSTHISIPQTTTQKRPDSRYNKETLYAKLDYGRASSPEYKVPVIDMNFSEVKKHQIIPECWK